MDREQTFDVVDTPPPDRRNWPSLENFQEPEETLKWHDIQPGMYKVLEIHNQGHNKFGLSVVLKLESRNGTTFLVWAPSSLFYSMEMSTGPGRVHSELSSWTASPHTPNKRLYVPY